jgi:hypothetical protein
LKQFWTNFNWFKSLFFILARFASVAAGGGFRGAKQTRFAFQVASF